MSAEAEAGGMVVRQRSTSRLLKKAAELAGNVLFWDNERLDVDSVQGRRALTLFLGALHSTGHALRVARAARGYHESLSERVRATWTDATCLYHIGIVTKSVHGEVYFNSRAYPLSDDAMALSCQLAERLSEVHGLLGRIRVTGAEHMSSSDVEDVRASLVAFDAAWALFEERFFLELPGIEWRARAVLVEAVRFVEELDRIAGNYEEDADPRVLMHDPEFLEKHLSLINCVARLNSEANAGTAARSFSPELLPHCEAVVEECSLRGGNRRSSVFVLSSDAVRTWDQLCCYLFQKARCMDGFHPNLKKNKRLVTLLEDWAVSWALAEAYVVDDEGRLALHTIVQHVRKATTIAPALAGMIDDHSADLFLVLPRLLLLCFLEDPLCVEPLLAQLLPHRFERNSDNSEDGVALSPDGDLAEFMDAYRRTWNLLVPAASAAARAERGDVGTVLQAILTNCLVDGVGDFSAHAIEGILDGPGGDTAKDVWKSFTLKLEGWSIELQRHCAKDWNHFTETLMRCLEAQRPTQTAGADSIP